MKNIVTFNGEKYEVDSADMTPYVPPRPLQAGDVFRRLQQVAVAVPVGYNKNKFEMGGLGGCPFSYYSDLAGGASAEDFLDWVKRGHWVYVYNMNQPISVV